MMVLILLCTLAVLIGFPVGYFLGFVHTEAERLMDAYLQGADPYCAHWVVSMEAWR